MKKFLLMTLLSVFGLTFAVAQNQAEIKFDKVSYDFGTFQESNPVHKTSTRSLQAVAAPFPSMTNAPLLLARKAALT